MTTQATYLDYDVAGSVSAPNRVPDVTWDFWVIKLMAVTMGETAADFLAVNLGIGLTTTTLLMTGVLAATTASTV